MAAKKKSAQVTDEPVVVEEELTDAPDAPDANTPAPGDPGEEPATTDDTDDNPDVTEEKPADTETKEPNPPADGNEPEIEPTTVMEENQPDTQNPQPSDFFGTPEPKSGGGFPKAVMAVLALLLVGGGVAGFMFLKSGGQFLGANTETTPTPMEETLPTPEASPATEDVDLTEFSVLVLNGTGTAGEAGKVKALLAEAGFEDVKTGNAPSEDNTVATISAKADVPAAAIKVIQDALKGSFTTEVGDELDSDEDHDIVVTTGGSTAKDASESAEEE